MRIINNPNPIEETGVTCEKCQCTYAYNNGDIKHESWNNGVLGPGCAGYCYIWVNCPNCGEAHSIVSESKSGYETNEDDMVRIEVAQAVEDGDRFGGNCVISDIVGIE